MPGSRCNHWPACWTRGTGYFSSESPVPRWKGSKLCTRRIILSPIGSYEMHVHSHLHIISPLLTFGTDWHLPCLDGSAFWEKKKRKGINLWPLTIMIKIRHNLGHLFISGMYHTPFKIQIFFLIVFLLCYLQKPILIRQAESSWWAGVSWGRRTAVGSGQSG